MKTREKYGMTVMLDKGVLDTSGDGCPECRSVAGGRCEECQAWADQTGDEIEKRVGQRFPECKTIWLSASQMGSYKAEHPDSIRCPDDIYEAVLG